MAKLIYPMNMSLDGYMEDASGKFDWTITDDETLAFWTEFRRSIGTDIYGRKMYETMVYWETVTPQTFSDFENENQAESMSEFAQLWQKTDKVVYSQTLQDVSSAKTRLDREFNPDAIRELKESSKAHMTISGPNLAFQAMQVGLVDELYLVVHPINVGGGKRALPDNLLMQLKLLAERHFTSGAVHLHYRVISE